MARGSSGAMVGYLVLGGLALFLFKKAQAKTPTPAGGSGTPRLYNPFPLPGPAPDSVDVSEVPGSMAPAVGPVTAAAAIWSNLIPTNGPAIGSVNFPSGSQSASVFLQWATDEAGNLYTIWSGQIYIVNPQSDMLGNYPARLLGS